MSIRECTFLGWIIINNNLTGSSFSQCFLTFILLQNFLAWLKHSQSMRRVFHPLLFCELIKNISRNTKFVFHLVKQMIGPWFFYYILWKYIFFLSRQTFFLFVKEWVHKQCIKNFLIFLSEAYANTKLHRMFYFVLLL